MGNGRGDRLDDVIRQGDPELAHFRHRFGLSGGTSTVPSALVIVTGPHPSRFRGDFARAYARGRAFVPASVALRGVLRPAGPTTPVTQRHLVWRLVLVEKAGLDGLGLFELAARRCVDL